LLAKSVANSLAADSGDYWQCLRCLSYQGTVDLLVSTASCGHTTDWASVYCNWRWPHLFWWDQLKRVWQATALNFTH